MDIAASITRNDDLLNPHQDFDCCPENLGCTVWKRLRVHKSFKCISFSEMNFCYCFSPSYSSQRKIRGHFQACYKKSGPIFDEKVK